jgi:hypothetical protein
MIRKNALILCLSAIIIAGGSTAAFGHGKHHGFKSDDFAQQDVCVDATAQPGATPGQEEASVWYFGACNHVQLGIGFVTRQVYMVPVDND